MSLLEAIVLGIVQGLTEFLPISSTAHLRIVPALVGWEDPGALFTAVTQLGTMAAVLIYFREDLLRIARAWLRSLREPRRRRDLDARLGWYILIGTLPVAVFGLLFRGEIETSARNLYVIALALIGLGLVLLLAERVGARGRELGSIRLRDGVAIGFAQALALIPGVSRSGATISAGLLLDFDRTTAARFSFLLSVPAVVLSGLFGLAAIITGPGGGDGNGLLALAAATFFAFLSGYAAIAFLLRFLANHSTLVFVGYRIVLGVLVLGLVLSGAIAAYPLNP